MLSKQKMIIDGAILLISKGHTLVKLTGTTLFHFYQKTWLHKLQKFHKKTAGVHVFTLASSQHFFINILLTHRLPSLGGKLWITNSLTLHWHQKGKKKKKRQPVNSVKGP